MFITSATLHVPSGQIISYFFLSWAPAWGLSKPLVGVWRDGSQAIGRMGDVYEAEPGWAPPPPPAPPDSAQSASVGASPLSHAGERSSEPFPGTDSKVSFQPEVDDM